MREFISNLHSDSKLFIADYDSYSIEKYKTPPESLLYITKIGMLLFDYLLLPAAFFWQSKEMAQIMLRLEEPISYGVVLPVIRDSKETKDIIDYFEHRVEESQKIRDIPVFSQPELATEIAGKKNERNAHQLHNINTFAHLDGTSIRGIYAQRWQDDLDNSRDINSIRLLLAQGNIPLDQIREIQSGLKEIARHPQFSRAYCIDYIQRNVPPGRIRTLLEERASWLYLRSNSDAYQSGFYYTRDPYNGMVFAENIGLLADTLSAFGLTREVIAALSVRDILKIKNSVEYQNFIIAYNGMVEKAYTQQENIVEVLQKKIVHEIRSEKARQKVYKSLLWIQGHSEVVFLALIANHFSGSKINEPVFTAATAGAFVPLILKRFDTLNRYMTQQSFLDFQNYIIEEKYRNQMICGLERFK